MLGVMPLWFVDDAELAKRATWVLRSRDRAGHQQETHEVFDNSGSASPRFPMCAHQFRDSEPVKNSSIPSTRACPRLGAPISFSLRRFVPSAQSARIRKFCWRSEPLRRPKIVEVAGRELSFLPQATTPADCRLRRLVSLRLRFAMYTINVCAPEVDMDGQLERGFKPVSSRESTRAVKHLH